MYETKYILDSMIIQLEQHISCTYIYHTEEPIKHGDASAHSVSVEVE